MNKLEYHLHRNDTELKRVGNYRKEWSSIQRVV